MDQQININELIINPINPRELSEFMEGKLIESILVFPNMLKVRPIIINKENIILGGNQRVECLKKIAEFSPSDLRDYMFNQKKYRQKSEQEQEQLVSYWLDWQKDTKVSIKRVVDLSPEEEKELLIKDNLHYGEDDIDIMKQHFDREAIHDILGAVPWNLYDYDDKINDSGIELVRTRSETFKCGYISIIITDEELIQLNNALDEYLASTNGKTDGFLKYLLS